MASKNQKAMAERLAKKTATKKGISSASSAPSGDDKGKAKIGAMTQLPIVDMIEAEVKEQLRLQRKKLFEGKLEEEMKDYLNTLLDCFHEVETKSQLNEVIINEALAKVKALTEEWDNLNVANILQQQQLVMEKADKLKVITEAKKATDDLNS
ncbi:hypothetical protein SESBI_48308 [Sesbania bispinosa]|nr:hypothetical protein SESBI_48308 [Sesbania bispinosa]